MAWVAMGLRAKFEGSGFRFMFKYTLARGCGAAWIHGVRSTFRATGGLPL